MEYHWNFTTGEEMDPWMIEEATVEIIGYDLIVEVSAPVNQTIYMMISGVDLFLVPEETDGYYKLLISISGTSGFEYDTLYDYYFTDRHNGDIKAPQFAGSFRTPEDPNPGPEWEIESASVRIDPKGNWRVEVEGPEGMDVYIVIDGVGSFKLTEGPPGEYEALIISDNFEEQEVYIYHFSDEEGGADLAPGFSDSLVQPPRIVDDVETEYVPSIWSICFASCCGIVFLVLVIVIIVVVIKKKGERGGSFDEE
jgi:hypothetical protein